MNLYHLTFLLVFLALQPATVYGQQPTQADSVKPDIRQPSKESIAKYQNNEAFYYGGTPKDKQSLMDKIKSWIAQQIDKLFANATVRSILEILLYLFFIGLIILLINQYLKGNIQQLFAANTDQRPNQFSINQAEDEKTDWDQLIDTAIDDQQYKLAIRYLYQQKLHNLQQGGYIEWQQNKTNHDYINEIKESQLRQLFRELTRYYEFTEYGGFSISSDDFTHIHSRFNEMATQIQTVE